MQSCVLVHNYEKAIAIKELGLTLAIKERMNNLTIDKSN